MQEQEAARYRFHLADFYAHYPGATVIVVVSKFFKSTSEI